MMHGALAGQLLQGPVTAEQKKMLIMTQHNISKMSGPKRTKGKTELECVMVVPCMSKISSQFHHFKRDGFSLTVRSGSYFHSISEPGGMKQKRHVGVKSPNKHLC